jgi:membrane fusion protein (multidrug efflux system)
MRNRTKSILVVLVLFFAAGILFLSAPALAGVATSGQLEGKPLLPAQDDGLGLSPIAAAGDWAAVQASGVLTVGTTASSPPFAYYTPGFQIDGFDAALMQAVADKLGVSLALVDYAFDGLPAALQVGQIDAIAAALTMTPERAAVVDFSMPYYLSAEAILAPTDSALQDVNLNTQDFTNLRLGVQRGTVYATWAKTHLIDMGRMPAANLQLFAREQDIVQALQQDRIDLGMMDLLPGQEYVRNGDARLVGSNQVLQQYAIAVRKGSSLLPQINLALTQLQQEGVLDKLHATYLAADEGTPPPTPTPLPAPACQDVSGYVADVPATDNQRVKAGDPLERIDDGDYRLAVQAATDRLATQDATIARIGEQAGAQRATIDQARAQLDSAEADQTRADAAFLRTQALSKSDFASRAQYDAALADKTRAAAAAQAARAALAAAQQGLAVLEAQQTEARRARAELETAKARAERDLSFTTIAAPFDGVVGNKAAQPGQYVQPGARLLALVPLDTVFVEANFKETQLARIKPGQKVEIEVDALAGRAIEGEVASIAPASGAQFSLLPPDNATGNFTKIVQRVPVRIAISRELAREGVLRPGLSVVAKVMTKADAPPPSASTFSAIAEALRGQRAR